MALLERVGTLLRANLNDLIDKAEDPEKMIKQLILDMQNQLLQVKTSVAITIAEQHALEKSQKDNADKHAEWTRKAELSVAKGKDDLARAALERAVSCQRMMENFEHQVTDQKTQVENLKTILRKLEQKLAETQARAQLLVSQHRRSRALCRASDAERAMRDSSHGNEFQRLEHKVNRAEAFGQAKAEMLADNIEEQLTALDRSDRVELLLAEIKARRNSQ